MHNLRLCGVTYDHTTNSLIQRHPRQSRSAANRKNPVLGAGDTTTHKPFWLRRIINPHLLGSEQHSFVGVPAMPPRNKRKHEAAAEEGRDVLGAHANDGIKKTTGAAAATESDRRMTLRSDETGTGKRLEEHSPPSSPPGQKKKKLKKSTAAGDDECDDEDDKQQPSTPSKPRETVKAQQRGRTEQAHASAPLADVISINRCAQSAPLTCCC